ncbi:uncharacterized protein [Gossypium hirsutum]|uniref:Disease resistance protein At4g27190-like leucine-rich repeats domain-containing protein n=1 Tax=Gossypium hirsutum TaxID=3635 RepID=A0ABM2Z7S9_GOSHI|nr:uncharacterized protein LOC107940507 [Gossypium hirsutum]
MIIKGCSNLKHVLSDSMVEYLQQLERLKISECKCIQEIISTESIIEEAFRNRYLICFPRLKTIKLKGLKKLIGFCHEDYTVKFPSLKTLEIESCPKLKGFIHNSKSKEIPTDAVFFNNKVAFPNLEKITISHLRNVKRIWHGQLHANSFSMLKELTVKECDVLLNIFPPLVLGVFQKLEKLLVTDCASLEEVFQLQAQGLNIEETLRQVSIEECSSLTTLFPFSIAKDLQQLESLTIHKSGLEEIVSKNVEGSDQQEIWFKFNQLSLLEFWNLPNLSCFYPGRHRTTWPALSKLDIYRCERVKIFGHEESQIQHSLFLIEKVIPQLERVSFSQDDIAMISDGQYEADLFCNIKFLEISWYSDESAVFPISFLKRFYNLEILHVVFCNFKELASFESKASEDKDMIITIPKIKELRLNMLNNIRHLWKQDSPLDHFYQGPLSTPKLHKLQSTETDSKERWAGDLNATVEKLYKEQVGYRGLKHLKLSEFPELVNIWSRNPQEMLDFTTLEFLEVCDSNNLRSIFNLSTAFTLGKLRKIEIKRCSNLEQVIKEEGSITTVEEAITDSSKIISIFPRLQSITVESCPSITSFYMGSKSLECLSLIKIKVADCSNMTTFASTFSRDEDKEAIIGDEVDKLAAFFSDNVSFSYNESAFIHLSHMTSQDS